MSISQDKNLTHYVAFKHDDSLVHRSHEANFYYLADDSINETKTFLLMPAGQDDQNTWYYVFTTDPKANECWTMDQSDDKLQDHAFKGNDYQRFAFVPDGDSIHIKNKATGQYLFKSDHLMDAHHPIRRAKLPQPGDDMGKFTFKMRSLEEAVSIPTLNNTGTVEPGGLARPPAPTAYGDTPSYPAKVLIGEELVPFFMVPSDPTSQGDLRMWQVNSRPYYVLRREQQWQWDPDVTINMIPNREVDTEVTVTCGLTKKTVETMETTVGMTFGVSKGTKASVGFEGVNVEASKGFQASFQKSLKVTTTNESTWSVDVTKSVTTRATSVTQPTTTIPWQLCDLWTIIYDSKNSEDWIVQSELILPLCYPSTAEAVVA